MKTSKLKNIMRRQTAMREHYEELFTTSVGELQFANIQKDFLLNILSEIETLTKDKIVKKVIENTKERYYIDRIIHNRNLFDN